MILKVNFENAFHFEVLLDYASM